MTLAGCCCPAPKKDPMDVYNAALKASEAKWAKTLDPQLEKEVTQRFTDFYKTYTADAIKKGIRDVYADDAFFADPFKAYQGIDALTDYFVRSTEPVKECTFDIVDYGSRDGNYYYRWVMNLTLKRSPKDPIVGLGMSHVRYGADGKIIFQQDYWDTSILFERFPIMGRIIRSIKNKM